MVNGRTLEEELKRIDDFFDSLDVEQFEKMAFECGAGEIYPSNESVYIKAVSRRYANVGTTRKRCDGAVFSMTCREIEAA